MAESLQSVVRSVCTVGSRARGVNRDCGVARGCAQLDLAAVAEALRQDRFGYVGAIGSKTKRARFVSQLEAAGFAEARIAKLVCPIGATGVSGKAPAVIAVAVAAQLLMKRDELGGSLSAMPPG